MTPASGRALGAVVALAVVAGPAMVQRVGAGAADCDGTVTARSDGWTEVVPPAFGEASDRITGLASSPQQRDLMYLTNGSSVQRSVDAGCTWQTVFSSETFHVGQLTVGPEPPRVVAVQVPPRDPRRLYVVLHVTTAAETSRVDVLTSADMGATYEPVVAGLPPSGAPLALAPGLRRGVAYLAVATTADDVDVYATDDSGASWARRGAIGTDELEGFAVDPRAERRLWAVAGSRLIRSDDGGATFGPVARVPQDVGALSVSLTGDSTQIIAAHRDAPRLSLSQDDGATWTQLRSPSVANSVAAPSGSSSAMAYAGNTGVYLAHRAPAAWIDVSPSGEQPTDIRLSDSYAAGYDLVGRTSRGVLRTTLTHALSRVVRKAGTGAPALPPIDLGRVPDISTGEAALHLPGKRYSLKPGEERDIDVLLELPPVPTPLDVVFLIDTTGSMSPTIAGLRDGIGEVVDDLAKAGIDAKFGLGDYRDYPFDGYGSEGDWPYRLLRKVGPPDGAFREAIEMLSAGGGGDGPESSLTAMYQAVTGAGDVVEGKTLVEKGRDVAFREDSLRVVLVATDTSFHQEPDYPGPSFEATAKALRDHRVLQMGLSVSGGGRPDLQEMARATGTFAPEGVDCDGDRTVDVRAGEPLVCDVEPLPIRVGLPGTQMNLAPAIIGLLRAVRDVAPVSLRARGAGSMAHVLAPATYANIDVKTPNRLRYRVRLSCTAQNEGRAARTTLEALRRSTVLVGEHIDVGCAAPAALAARPQPPPPVTPGAPEPPAALAAAPPPPPPPPQQLPQSNPQPQAQTQAQPQPNPNPQMQAGGAYEEQEEHQLALAHVDVEEDVELAMSSRPRGAPDPRPLWASALALSVAAGVAARRRTTAQGARAWARR